MVRQDAKVTIIQCDQCGALTQFKHGQSQPPGWVQVRTESGDSDYCPTCKAGLILRPGLLSRAHKAAGSLVLGIALATSILSGHGAASAHRTHHPAATLCSDLRTALNTGADVDERDFLLHSAGCDDDPYHPDTGWAPERDSRCARRAFWLVQHGHSILRTRELLATRGCTQFEDGTYDEA